MVSHLSGIREGAILWKWDGRAFEALRDAAEFSQAVNHPVTPPTLSGLAIRAERKPDQLPVEGPIPEWLPNLALAVIGTNLGTDVEEKEFLALAQARPYGLSDLLRPDYKFQVRRSHPRAPIADWL
jgi:hypothetical protein